MLKEHFFVQYRYVKVECSFSLKIFFNEIVDLWIIYLFIYLLFIGSSYVHDTFVEQLLFYVPV